jgi:amidase
VQRFSADDLKFTYSGDHQPIGRVEPGEVFLVETADCFTGRFAEPSGFTDENLAWVLSNLDGVTGPVYVNGATPEQVVAVTLHEVEIVTPGSIAWSTCRAASPRDWWGEWYASDGLEIKDNHILFGEARIPVSPLIGCIATAPDRETVFSKMQGPYGGNMDSNEVSKGATVVLPVSVDGAYLYFGDAKARMGDGEVVQAPEVGTRITASVDLRPRPERMRWPRVESSSHLTTLVSGLSIDDAAALAFAEMLAWGEEISGMARPDLALLLGMIANVGICQFANTLHTAKCTVERSLLSGALAQRIA